MYVVLHYLSILGLTERTELLCIVSGKNVEDVEVVTDEVLYNRFDPTPLQRDAKTKAMLPVGVTSKLPFYLTPFTILA